MATTTGPAIRHANNVVLLDHQHDKASPVVASHTSQTSQASQAAAPTEATKECVICFVEPINTVFVPCGHLYACETCALRIYEATGTCPICRSDITGTMRTYSA